MRRGRVVHLKTHPVVGIVQCCARALCELCAMFCSQAFCVHDGTWKDCGQHLDILDWCRLTSGVTLDVSPRQLRIRQGRLPQGEGVRPLHRSRQDRGVPVAITIDGKLGAKLGK